jgi:hypothetical protein
VYTNPEEQLIITLYVDDGLIVGKSIENIEKVLRTIQKEFEITVTEATYNTNIRNKLTAHHNPHRRSIELIIAIGATTMASILSGAVIPTTIIVAIGVATVLIVGFFLKNESSLQ